MPRRIAPAKQAERLLIKQAHVELKEQTIQRQLHAESVAQQLQQVEKRQRQKKAGPLALDPALGSRRPGNWDKVNQRKS